MSKILLGLTFLIIGESHFVGSHSLIGSLPDVLVADGAKVYAYGACGVPAGAWTTAAPIACGTSARINAGPVVVNYDRSAMNSSIDQLMQRTHPSVIVVESGDTVAGYDLKAFPAATISRNVDQLLARIKTYNVPCVWVGPSWGTEGGPFFKTFGRVKQTSDYLKTVVAPCHYIDSLAFSTPGAWPTFDGLHYTVPGYRSWGAAIAQALVADPALRMSGVN